MKRLLFALLLLTACTQLNEGWVREKRFTPEHDETWLMPMYEQYCSGYGTDRYCYEQVAYYIPITTHYPDAWAIKIESDEEETDWISVSLEEYNDIHVGNYWRRPMEPSPGLPVP